MGQCLGGNALQWVTLRTAIGDHHYLEHIGQAAHFPLCRHLHGGFDGGLNANTDDL